MNYDDAVQRLLALEKVLPHKSKWHHVKSGNDYEVFGLALRESDLTVMVAYSRSDATRIMWLRPASEFLGRFRRIV